MNDLTLDILYQDDAMIVINKPSGLLVHRTHLDKHETDAVVQRLRDQIGQWVFPIHRLDRSTSGVLVLALSPSMARELAQQFEADTLQKKYLTIVRGHPPQTGDIDYPLATLSEQKGRARFKIEGTEKSATTHYDVMEHFQLPYAVSRYDSARCSLVSVIPKQGRKHQIRRHFKHIHHPILGDTRYGCRHYNQLLRQHNQTQRLLLHAQSIQLQHPRTKETLHIEAPITADFQSTLDWLMSHQYR